MSSSAGARNVSEFTENANTGEVTASSAAPTAGPITIVRFATSVFRAFAAARSSSPTRVGVIAIIEGTYAVPNAVVVNARSVTSRTGPFAAAVRASAAIAIARRTSDQIMTIRRSNRSAMTPPIGASTT